MKKRITRNMRVAAILACVSATLAALKLTGVIGWTWWWIAAPLWLPGAMVIGIIAVMFIVMLTGIAARIIKEILSD